MFKRIVLYMMLCCSFVAESLYSQKISSGDKKADMLPIWERFSFHTNVVDWAILTPNLGVEWELSGSSENRFSILLNGKYNWNTKNTVNPRTVYNLSGISVEGRRYWRTSGSARKIEKRDTTLSIASGIFMKMRRNLFSGRVCESPRDWRAYYLGLYLSMDNYTIAFGKEGKQGQSYNIGVSSGWSIPLYPLKNGHCLDLDLGCTLVAKFTEYNKFRYKEDDGCYVYAGTRKAHFVPFPVVQNIHVSLVYRFRSISTKVKGGEIRYEEWEKRQAEKQKRRRDRIDSLFLKQDSIQRILLERKELKRKKQEIEQMQKDSIRQIKLIQDSLAFLEKKELKRLKKDSLKFSSLSEEGKYDSHSYLQALRYKAEQKKIYSEMLEVSCHQPWGQKVITWLDIMKKEKGVCV